MARKVYIGGAHRGVPPEETLRVAWPLARSLGVTRCADVTGLDVLDIPVYCAIRPRGVTLQIANGKGCTDLDARVSALMEAIEHAWVERAPKPAMWASVAELRRRGVALADPQSLQLFDRGVFYTENRVLPWVEGEALPAETPMLVPAPFVYPIEPRIFVWSSNGLASGNDVREATLHGLYEVCERHSLSLLTLGETVELDGCQAINVSSIDDPVLAPLISSIERTSCQLILFRVDLDWKIHTFLAFLLDPSPYRGPSVVNFGAGAHLSRTVAAARAITEAAQSRLTFIHGSREDLPLDAYRGRHTALYKRLVGVVGTASWRDISDMSSPDLETDYDLLMDELHGFGFTEVFRVILPPPSADVSVVKVIIVGSELNFPL